MQPAITGKKYDKIAQWWHDQHVDSSYGVSQLERAAIRKLVLPIVELPFHIGKNDEAGVSITIERIHNLLSEYESIA